MSTIITTDIQCDACPKWAHGVTHPSKTRTRAARNKLSSHGWQRAHNPDAPGWLDLCPDCAKQHMRAGWKGAPVEQLAPLLRDIREEVGSLDATCEVTGLAQSTVSSITYRRQATVTSATADAIRRTWVSLFGEDQLCSRCDGVLGDVSYDDGDGGHLCSDCTSDQPISTDDIGVTR